MRAGSRAVLASVVLALVAACGDGAVGITPVRNGEASARSGVTGNPTDHTDTVDTIAASCPGGEAPMREDESVQLEQIADTGEVTVHAAEYPVPGATSGLWSQWGQGAIGANGMHYSGVGDHIGPDGNSYLFEYDPGERRLSRFIDVLSLVDHQPGAWGYGKLHSQMVADACGALWLFTYWGTRDDLEYGQGYEGDLLLRIDTRERAVTNYGPVVGRRGVPSLIGTEGGRYLVAEAVDHSTDDGDLVIFDTIEGRVTHTIDDPDHIGFRALAVDARDNVLYSVMGSEARMIDSSTGEWGPAGFDWPAGGEDFLRAATPLYGDGNFVGVMNEQRTLFTVDAGGEVTALASSGGYTTSLAMSETGDRVFWLPRAHGGAWEMGATIQVMDTSSGEVDEVVSLREPFESELGLLPGGTYSAVYHDGRLILGINASDVDEEDPSGFGTVVLVVIEGL